MYVTTFYSFKGGVGRTMALVNVAVDLALRGRRVLAVDFDIEAPGLDTFAELRPPEETAGIVDFVTQYLKLGQAPNIEDFVAECPAVGEHGGRLWVMPSGKKEGYTENFNQLNWGELYDKHEGYLLFEDLKQQWFRILEPEYVLIDSRTGHTDTSGICTRQLPDSVVILFFPNEQNLRGLIDVVRNIRSEADEPRRKRIELHFVMSNVPDLDDEDRILKDKIGAFQQQLSFHRKPMIVHRYDSLSLLNQVVFTKHRPQSRLAKEYGSIVRKILSRNWKDRIGALDYIQLASRRPQQLEDDSLRTREHMLEKIEDAHVGDGEVLFRLSELREAGHQAESAASLVIQAIDAGYDQPDGYLKRSRIRMDNKDPDGAREDAWRTMNSDQITPPMIREAIGRLAQLGTLDPAKIINSTAVGSLEPDDKIWLATTFNRSLDDLAIAISMWENFLSTDDIVEDQRVISKHHLGLSYMGLGRCADATQMFRSEGDDIGDLSIENAFNYGMAIWGAKRRIDKEVFQRVADLNILDTEKNTSANYFQCMAVSYWALGNNNESMEYVKRAQQAIGGSRGRTEFSCWRYLQVNAEVFESDLNEIRMLFEVDEFRLPRFASNTKRKSYEAAS